MTQIDHHRMQIADLRINASQPFLQETLLPQLSTFVKSVSSTSPFRKLGPLFEQLFKKLTNEVG